MSKERQIAFVGNPNVGKSAWINALSNANFKVGNWPGVTVEKKEAIVNWNHAQYHLIDLPGTYALEDGDNEEAITARYLMHEHIDLIVNVVDATNLSRNLYLTCKLRQLHIPMIIIFNFMDEVEKYEININIGQLEDKLELPIYPYSAFDVQGKKEVIQGILQHAGVDKEVHRLCTNKLLHDHQVMIQYLKRRIPLYVHPSQTEIADMAYDILMQKQKTLIQLQAWNIELPQHQVFYQEDQELFQVVQDLMQFVKDPQLRFHRTRSIDRIFLHPFMGMICMFVLLALLMMFVFQGSAPFNDFIDFLINDMVMKYANALLFFLPQSAKALVLHGVIAGVGGVLVFIPLMAFLYFVLSFLEESGIMSRIAYLLDPLMQHFHLNGKSFVALLLGFGCNVPAVFAARTLDHEKQKKLTALLVPFMSCGARLPVYMIFAAAFFKEKAAIMVLSMYGIGIFIALFMALICSHTKQFHDDEILVMELPPYRLPSLQVLRKKVSEEVKGYIRKATSVVLWAMVILWSLTYFPHGTIESSYLSQFAKTIAPIYEPLGFGNRWESVAALPGSIIAKETVVGFLDQVLLQSEEEPMEELNVLADAKEIAYEFGSACRSFVFAFIPHAPTIPQQDSLVMAISNLWIDELANLRAYCYMVYILLSIPCVMTLQALYREYGVKLMLLSIGLMLVIPYIVALGIFQLFSLLI